MTRTTTNLAAFAFAIVLTAITFQQALLVPGAQRPAAASVVLA